MLCIVMQITDWSACRATVGTYAELNRETRNMRFSVQQLKCTTLICIISKATPRPRLVLKSIWRTLTAHNHSPHMLKYVWQINLFEHRNPAPSIFPMHSLALLCIWLNNWPFQRKSHVFTAHAYTCVFASALYATRLTQIAPHSQHSRIRLP